MIELQIVSLAFAAGMVATINPCGFAMLPAYLSFFLGLQDESVETGKGAVPRALAVGGVLTLGFVAVFGLFGLIWTPFQQAIGNRLPWITVVIAFFLVVLGIAMLRGYEPKVNIPRLQKGAGSKDLPSMFLFGVSYAIASLSCTIGPFLALTQSTFRSSSFSSGVAAFVAYGLGMGSVLMVLTLGLALAKASIATNLRRMLPFVNRASAVLLIVAGLYVGFYGYWEARVLSGNSFDNPAIDFVEEIRSSATNWMANNSTNIGIAIGLVILAAVGTTMARRFFKTPPAASAGDDTETNIKVDVS